MLKSLLIYVIKYSGFSFFLREIYARNKVTIILYHDPDPKVLDNHLKFIIRKYNVISLKTLVEAIYERNRRKIPPKSLVITFDDGHKTNYQLNSIFKKYKIIPTIYICSQIVNTSRKYWFKLLPEKTEDLKILSNKKRLKILNEQTGFFNEKEYSESERHALNINELFEMKDHFDFQSHTQFHPVLTTCSVPECQKEIFQSKEDIEKMLETPCLHFSYPNGDYTEREVEMVKKAGYLSARTIDCGFNSVNTDPYKLKCFGVSDNNDSITLLQAQLSGVLTYFRYLFKGSPNGKYPTIKLRET